MIMFFDPNDTCFITICIVWFFLASMLWMCCSFRKRAVILLESVWLYFQSLFGYNYRMCSVILSECVCLYFQNVFGYTVRMCLVILSECVWLYFRVYVVILSECVLLYC